MSQSESNIRLHASAPPVVLPPGHVGLVSLDSNRQIWWTGRVAIGLRYERRQPSGPLAQSAAWVQDLMLARKASKASSAS